MAEQLGICENETCVRSQNGQPIPIEDGTLECPDCGKILKPYEAPNSWRNQGLLPLIMAIVVLLFLVIGGVYFMLSRNSELPPPANGSVETSDTSDSSNTSGLELPFFAEGRCPAETVKIDAGSYAIGKQHNAFLKRYKEKYRNNHGGGEPLEVTIKHPFCLQLTEVLVDEFKQFLNSEDPGLTLEQLQRLKIDTGSQNNIAPVENVSKTDAEKYALWLGKQTGKRWQLPTMRQWMVAVVKHGEQSPVTGTTNSEPVAKEKGSGKVQHLLGNMREWSRDPCPGNRYQLLGRNYIAGDSTDPAYCHFHEHGSPGVGFRLVYQLDGE